MRKYVILGVCGLFCSQLFAVSMNFTGSFRAEADYYNKLNLGLPSTPAVPQTNAPKQFISSRALLDPNLVIDDHFSLKSEWTLLSSPGFTPAANSPLGYGNGGLVFGDVNSVSLYLNRAFLEWTSDFGVLRVGRMPVSWGYGLLYDGGAGMWDDFQSTLDRIEYRLHLGHVVGALAYSKPRKLNPNGSVNDQDFYSAFLQYENPELEVEGGLMYEKQVRSGQDSDLTNQTPGGATSANPYYQPPNPYNYPLATLSPYPLSNNFVDVYLKKTVNYFTFGGELGWISGTAVRMPGISSDVNLNALSTLLSVQYEYHKFKTFLEFMYASGDSSFQSLHLNGFVVLNRNRRPGLILGRELLGPYAGNTVGQGSLVVYGNPGSFSGAMYLRPGVRYEWSQSIASGLEAIIAQKAATQPGESSNLGVEFDLSTDYSVYKNFDLGVDLGYLFPGNGLQVPNPQGPFAARATAALKF